MEKKKRTFVVQVKEIEKTQSHSGSYYAPEQRVEVDKVRNMIIGLVLVLFAIIIFSVNIFFSIPGYDKIFPILPILGFLGAIIFFLNIPY